MPSLTVRDRRSAKAGKSTVRCRSTGWTTRRLRRSYCHHSGRSCAMNRINMTLAAIAFALFAIAATTASPASVKGQTQMTFCKSQVQGSPNYDAVMPDGIELWGDSCFYYSGTINWNVYSYNLSKYNGNYYNHYAQESQVFGYDVCSNQTMAE